VTSLAISFSVLVKSLSESLISALAVIIVPRRALAGADRASLNHSENSATLSFFKVIKTFLVDSLSAKETVVSITV